MKLVKAYGFTLIEILVSLLLMSVILFGFDAIEIYSLKQAKTAYFLGIAVNQMANMSERLIALQTHTELAEQVNRWNQENQSVLPNGFGVVMGHFPNYILSLYWGGKLQSCVKNQLGEPGCLREKIYVVYH
ncbi:MAG: hypothetical protein ACD_45C00012G0010 [uncultured bacterium]|nr:MAG: hypothetical protein ACD_45C00012G0010 [uncultured bacterium]